MNITVFGGSNPTQADYHQAELLGTLLGQRGYTVLTGGYIGVMEAVSKGAALTGAHVIGVTCDQLEAWRPVKPNRWITEERRYATLRERLFALIDGCDAAIALPGGPGTLTEIALTWNLILTESISCIPLILIGDQWFSIFQYFYDTLGVYTPESQRRYLDFVKSPEDALRILEDRL